MPFLRKEVLDDDENSSSHKISRVTHESRYENSSALKGEE